MAAASAASIVQQAREDSDAALAQLHVKSDELSAEIQTRFEAQAADARGRGEADIQRLSIELQATLKQRTQDELGNARKELLAQVGAAREELSDESQAQRKQLTEYVAALNGQAIDDYRRKLEAASNSWLLTTASKLSQQSEQQLQALARSAEERLRDTCNEVFSGVGESSPELSRRTSMPVPAPPTQNGQVAHASSVRTPEVHSCHSRDFDHLRRVNRYNGHIWQIMPTRASGHGSARQKRRSCISSACSKHSLFPPFGMNSPAWLFGP